MGALGFVFLHNMTRQARLAHLVLWAIFPVFRAFWAELVARSQLGLNKLQTIKLGKGNNLMSAGYCVSVCAADCPQCKVSALAATLAALHATLGHFAFSS